MPELDWTLPTVQDKHLMRMVFWELVLGLLPLLLPLIDTFKCSYSEID
jgi:hypothetical protein